MAGQWLVIVIMIKIGDKYWASTFEGSLVRGKNFILIVYHIEKYSNNDTDLLTIVPKGLHIGWNLSRETPQFFNSTFKLTYNGYWVYEEFFLKQKLEKF